MTKYIGAIDQGTTSTRFIVFDKAGRVVNVAQREHAQVFPRPGWVEHSPEEIVQRAREVISEALATSGLAADDLAAIGITNQRETTIVWEEATGEPVMNAIVWQDTRVTPDVAAFSKQYGHDRFREKTGLPLSTYFSSLKLRWIMKNVPGVARRAQAGELLFGTVDTFLLWHLTGGAKGGVHATDVTNASRTQLLNLHTLDWDDELLATFEIPRCMLPQVRTSSELYKTVVGGPAGGVPIAGILGDQQAALVGQVCFRPGEVKNTYGTGCFLLMNTGKRAPQSKFGLLTTVAYRFGNAPACYALEGSVAIAGALVQWLRDNLGLIQKSSDVETLARTVNDNGGVYLVPAFSGLYAPYWTESARGVIAGLTRYANKGHLARAVLEATAFQTRDVVEAMEKDAGFPLAALRVDGGMVTNELLMQFQSDILNRDVVRPVVAETTALGAAYAAGIAVGFYAGTDELQANWKVDRRWKPKLAEPVREKLYGEWKKAVTRSFDWIENESRQTNEERSA